MQHQLSSGSFCGLFSCCPLQCSGKAVACQCRTTKFNPWSRQILFTFHLVVDSVIKVFLDVSVVRDHYFCDQVLFLCQGRHYQILVLKCQIYNHGISKNITVNIHSSIFCVCVCVCVVLPVSEAAKTGHTWGLCRGVVPAQHCFCCQECEKICFGAPKTSCGLPKGAI